MNLFLIVLLLCKKITGNAISLQKEQILSREEKYRGTIIEASNDAGNLSKRNCNLLNDLL